MSMRIYRKLLRRHLALLLLLTAVATGCQSTSTRSADDNQPGWLGEVLPGFGGPTAGETAREAFNVYSPDRRREAIDRLSAAPYGGDAVYVRMYRLLIDDPDASVRASCAKALGLHGSPADVERIVPLLEEDEAFARWEAAKALQKLHNPDAASPLVSVVQDDEDADVRQDAARALGQYRSNAVFQTLVGALHDTNYSVARAARESLITLTGTDMGSEARDWLTWADAQRGSGGVFADARDYTYQPWTPIPGFFKQLFIGDPLADPREPAGWDRG